MKNRWIVALLVLFVGACGEEESTTTEPTDDMGTSDVTDMTAADLGVADGTQDTAQADQGLNTDLGSDLTGGDVFTDGGTAGCFDDSECDDGEACTEDSCVIPADSTGGGTCVSTPVEDGLECGDNMLCYSGACIDVPVCGDGEVAGEELCDDGNTDEGDYCNADCSEITGSCGDDILQDIEACDDANTDDGDYCSSDCLEITGFCGDGILQDIEACDDGGTDPGDGCDRTCNTESFEVGDVIFSEFMSNPAGLLDEDAEWFEIYNTTDSDLDISGWYVSDETGSPYKIFSEEPFIIASGGYALFTRKCDPALTGLPDFDYCYETSDSGLTFTLNNSADSLSLTWNDLEIDNVTWSNISGWVLESGASAQLSTDALDSVSNDDASNWCNGSVVYWSDDSDSNSGTPGTDNLLCE